MNNLGFVAGYRDNQVLRSSFNRLALRVFGIDFEGWYNIGGWDDRYICYSYADGNDVVANISINIMDIILKGRNRRALQIGTVMTHPDYCNRGLSKSLMNRILEEHKNNFDFIYLFADEKVFGFYPKFGFRHFHESRFYLDVKDVKSEESRLSRIRKLNISNGGDLEIIVRLASDRMPVSKKLGVENDRHLLLFHCLNTFSNNLYYLKDEDIIVIFKRENGMILLYDIISRKEIRLRRVLDRICDNTTKKALFQFVPDAENLEVACEPIEPDNGLFIISDQEVFAGNFLFPATSHA